MECNTFVAAYEAQGEQTAQSRQPCRNAKTGTGQSAAIRVTAARRRGSARRYRGRPSRDPVTAQSGRGALLQYTDTVITIGSGPVLRAATRPAGDTTVGRGPTSTAGAATHLPGITIRHPVSARHASVAAWHPPTRATLPRVELSLFDNPRGLVGGQQLIDTPPGAEGSQHQYGNRNGGDPRTPAPRAPSLVPGPSACCRDGCGPEWHCRRGIGVIRKRDRLTANLRRHGPLRQPRVGTGRCRGGGGTPGAAGIISGNSGGDIKVVGPGLGHLEPLSA